MLTLVQILRESPYYPKLRGGLVALLAVHLLGATVFLQLSDWQAPPLDALYMAFNVISTVGFAEVIDVSKSAWGRLFTMALGFTGIAITWYLFSVFTAFILESNLNQAYRRRRMESTLATLSGHYIVCGIGRVGSYVADELLKTRREFVVVDPDAKCLADHEARTAHRLHVQGDASDDEVLLRAGVARAAGVFAVTDDDSKNLVVSLSARQLNPSVRIVARVHDRRQFGKARRAGADEIVSPDFTGGMRIASAMLRPNAVHVMDMMLHTEENIRVEEVSVPEGALGRTVGSLGSCRDWLLLALRDAQSRWHFNPAPETAVAPGDTLVAVVSPQGRRMLEDALTARPGKLKSQHEEGMA